MENMTIKTKIFLLLFFLACLRGLSCDLKITAYPNGIVLIHLDDREYRIFDKIQERDFIIYVCKGGRRGWRKYTLHCYKGYVMVYRKRLIEGYKLIYKREF